MPISDDPIQDAIAAAVVRFEQAWSLPECGLREVLMHRFADGDIPRLRSHLTPGTLATMARLEAEIEAWGKIKRRDAPEHGPPPEEAHS